MDEYSVVQLCKVLEVSPSGFYKWRNLQLTDEWTERQLWREELKQKIAQSYHESYGTYGSPAFLKTSRNGVISPANEPLAA